MAKKKVKLKKANIFIFFNIVFILGCCIFYGYRLVYYYKLEHPKTVEHKTFAEILTANVAYDGDGLYKNEDEYLYRGIEVNNYVYYSGRLWRIVKINSNNSIKLITADNETVLVWGLDNEYNNSYVKKWLEEVFFPTINQPDRYLVEDTYCVDKILDDVTSCLETEKSKFGLISYNEYSMAGMSESYLNIDSYFWTINGTSEDDTWYVTNSGKISNVSRTINKSNAYGVRPTVTVSSNVELTGGDGTIDNPYTFEADTGNKLSGKHAGEYITYSGMNWRIINVSDTGIKVALDGFITIDGEEVEQYFSKSTNKFHKSNTNIGYYLNTDFYNTLENKDYIVEGKWGTGQYNDYVDYDYTNVTYQMVDANVGLLNVGDSFIGDYSNYCLITGESSIIGTILQPSEDGTLFAESIKSNSKIRPALYLRSDLTITSGNGTKKSPYVIG